MSLKPTETYPATPIESIMSVLHDELDGEANGALVLRVEGCVDECAMDGALRLLQKRHPKLRATIHRNDDGTRSISVSDAAPPISFEMIDTECTSDSWQERAEQFCTPQFDTETGPLMRVLVLRDSGRGLSDVIVGGHHAISDGTSVMHVMMDLLEFHAALVDDAGMYRETDVDVTSRDYVPSVMPEVNLSLSKKAQFAARLGARIVSDRWRPNSPFPVDGDDATAFSYRTVFSEEETAALLHACREEGVTVYGALCAAGLLGMSRSLNRPNIRISLTSPVSVRNDLPAEVGPADLGCFVSAYKKNYSVSETESFWQLARRCRADTEGYVARRGPSVAVKLLAAMDLSSWLRRRSVRQRACLMVNNMGRASFPEQYGPLRPIEMSWVARGDNTGTSVKVLAVTLQGRLNVTVGAAGLTLEHIEEMRETICGILKTIHGQNLPDSVSSYATTTSV